MPTLFLLYPIIAKLNNRIGKPTIENKMTIAASQSHSPLHNSASISDIIPYDIRSIAEIVKKKLIMFLLEKLSPSPEKNQQKKDIILPSID